MANKQMGESKRPFTCPMTLRESHREGAPLRDFFTGRTPLLFNAVSDPTNIIPIKPITCGIEHSTTLGQTSRGNYCVLAQKNSSRHLQKLPIHEKKHPKVGHAKKRIAATPVLATNYPKYRWSPTLDAPQWRSSSLRARYRVLPRDGSVRTTKL